MKTYTIDNKSHLRHLWIIILLIFVIPIISHYMMILKSTEYTFSRAIYIGVVSFLVFILPILAIHFNHYLTNKGCTLEYNKDSHQFIYIIKGKKIKFNRDDIECITVFKSWSMEQGKTPTMPTDIYNYAVVKLKDGYILKISSLLVYEFDKVFNFKNIEVKKRLYPWIS